MPDPGELGEVLRRSRGWLSVEGTRPSASLRTALQSLFGAWACDRGLREEEPSEELRLLTDRALEQLDREGAGFDGYSYDPKLLLLCLRVFAQDGRDAPAIRTCADSIASTLASLPRIPARHAGTAAMLDELGYPGIALDLRPDEPSVDELLRLGPEAVRAACSAVAAWTHFGARQLEGLRFEALRRVLPVILLQSLRSHDLDTAAMLLRTSRYLRMRPSRQLEEGISFLVDQQKSDGRFGYFAVEASKLSGSDEVVGFDEISTLYLPVTVTCTWAVAELVTGGCLLFGRRGDRPRDRIVPESQMPSYTS
jgi:hypothetical protein